ncbi:MAG: DUF2779 domain-containing protein [Bacteriovoracaceae bacterium]
MKKPRYLTKSRFKLALECPAKLFYSGKSEYANAKDDDPFLKALANGGFQVGALAQCYYPNGIEIETLDYVESIKQTNELLKLDNVIISEAALQFDNLFIRVDILEKIGNVINLIEVKSKSFDPTTFSKTIWNKIKLKKEEYSLNNDWRPYLYDIAFQAFVAKKSLSGFKINSFLMCSDKSKLTSVDGLNQRFMITTDPKSPSRNKIQVKGDVSLAALGEKIVSSINVNDVVEIIHSGKELSIDLGKYSFEEFITFLAEKYKNDEMIPPILSNTCRDCEFRTHVDNKKSGFDECWTKVKGLSKEELEKPFVFDVWNFGGADKLLEKNIILMEDITPDVFKVKDSEDLGLSNSERQWLQIDRAIEGSQEIYFETTGLRLEMSKWKFPLHMIDFETCMAAIPFNKGKRPYEQIAFQFSHHIVYENGTIEHKSEFISNTPGFFPNFDFVRALKKALEKDQGTIFRYSHHENSVLCQIKNQLDVSSEVDKKELIDFIKTITKKKEKEDEESWEGDRLMVDLCEMVKKYYYNPATEGSNSIKYVLPAILNESKLIQEKYSKPIYNSKNYQNKAWIEFTTDGKVKDPYKSLGKVFGEFDYERLENNLSGEESEIKDGGAALTAYALMQFTEMSEIERQKITEALLRYCELDTLAMVMIWEHWDHLIKT